MFQGKNKNANDHIKKYVGNQQATVVAANTIFKGDIEFQGAVIIQGKVCGTVKSQEGAVSISASGSVDGEIQVPFVEIYGDVKGNILSSASVILGKTANVCGNLQYGILSIEEGAVFEGQTQRLGGIKVDGNIIEVTSNNKNEENNNLKKIDNNKSK